SAAGGLRVDACAVRSVRGRWVGQPQDDHLLDAQQPLAVVLRTHLRLLPATRWCVLRREEGAAAAVRGLRFVSNGKPRPRQYHRGQPNTKTANGFDGPSARV